VEAEQADETAEQAGTQFGERMDHVLGLVRRRQGPMEPLVIVGADTPHLAPTAYRAAFEALERHPSVLGRSPRGGFYILGFARRIVPVRAALAGSDEAGHLERELKRRRLAPARLPEFFDVDEPDDLRRLSERLESAVAPEWIPPATQEALTELGWIHPRAFPPAGAPRA
jgi:glycosyltransferase A (GT-A) superfamily protein (DUF2064 family)